MSLAIVAPSSSLLSLRALRRSFWTSVKTIVKSSRGPSRSCPSPPWGSPARPGRYLVQSSTMNKSAATATAIRTSPARVTASHVMTGRSLTARLFMGYDHGSAAPRGGQARPDTLPSRPHHKSRRHEPIPSWPRPGIVPVTQGHGSDRRRSSRPCWGRTWRPSTRAVSARARPGAGSPGKRPAEQARRGEEAASNVDVRRRVRRLASPPALANRPAPWRRTPAVSGPVQHGRRTRRPSPGSPSCSCGSRQRGRCSG